MVICRSITAARAARTGVRAMLITEAVVAMGILVMAVIPLGYLFLKDSRLFRISYQRAVAVEMVDGQMEILAAGEWQSFPEGTNSYSAHPGPAAHLPAGRLVLVRSGKHLQLKWTPEKRGTGIGSVVREVTLP